MELPSLKGLVKSGLDSILNSASGIISKFKADPTKVIELETELEKLRIQAEQEADKITVQLEEMRAKEVEIVDERMREGGSSEHVMVWSWRLMIGCAVCAMLVSVYVLLADFK